MMEKLDKVARYGVDGYGRQDIYRDDEGGEFVYHDDFKAMQQRAEAAEALNKHLDLAVRKAEGVSEALRRRAEDAENERFRLDRESQNLSNQLGDCDRKRREALAKLAELDRQEAIFQVEVSGNHWLNAGPVEDSDFTGLPDGINLLYARPAPAINLAGLVPQPFDVFKQAGGVMVAVREGKTKNHMFGKGYNACVAEVINRIISSGELTRTDCESEEAMLCEILRKIEESK